MDGDAEGQDVAFPPGVLAHCVPSDSTGAAAAAPPKKNAANMRGSFTELGGTCAAPSPEDAKKEGPAAPWVHKGDRVRCSVPGLDKFHDKEGTVVEDLGGTNAPRALNHCLVPRGVFLLGIGPSGSEMQGSDHPCWVVKTDAGKVSLNHLSAIPRGSGKVSPPLPLGPRPTRCQEGIPTTFRLSGGGCQKVILITFSLPRGCQRVIPITS